MDRLKNYMHDFWNDESGMELLQLELLHNIHKRSLLRSTQKRGYVQQSRMS